MPKKKLDPSDFFTRSRANEGIKLPLSLPEGTQTDEFLVIRGIDSDEFRQAEQEANFQLLLMMQKEKKQREAGEEVKPDLKARKLNKLKMIAALIAGWSFKEELTQDQALELLVEAPSLAEEIDRVATDRQRFFKKPSETSSSSPEKSSS